jgi:hypothetical protein
MKFYFYNKFILRKCIARRRIKEYSRRKCFYCFYSEIHKLTFHTSKLKIKRGIQVDVSEYYTIQNQHKSWGKVVENKHSS